MEKKITPQYTFEEFESFAKSMKKISDVLASRKPNYIFAPVIGSIPLIEVLSIMNRHFPIDNVEYPPNSSRFPDRSDLIERWYNNFLEENYVGDPLSIVCVDEVISGSSATKGYNEFRRSLLKFGETKGLSLDKKVNYFLLGVGEKPKNGKRNPNFNRLILKKKAQVFEAEKIITADNIDLNPVRLKTGDLNPQGRQNYLPEIDSFKYGESYLNLLEEVAKYCGADPSQIQPLNVLKVRESLERYLKKG